MPITDVTEEMRDARPRHLPRPHRGRRARARDRAARRRRRVRHAPAQDQRGAVAGADRARRARRQAQPVHAEGHRRGAWPTSARRARARTWRGGCWRRSGAAKDDTVLVGVDAPGPLAMAMGILRLEMGTELKLVDENGLPLPLGHRLPALRVRRAATERFVSVQPPVHRARATRTSPLLDTDPGPGARQGLRHRAQRHRGRAAAASVSTTPACRRRSSSSCP